MVEFRKPLLAAALLLTAADTSVRPGDDFYHYANNAWLKTTQLPEGATRIDTTAMLRAGNARRVQLLLDDAVKAVASGRPVRGDVRRIADYYTTRLDTARIEARGLAPLVRDLAAITAIGDRRALASWLGRTVRLDDGGNVQTESLWGIYIHQGFHDPDHYAVHFMQGGLGMADPADYRDPARRAAYRARVAKLLALAGFDHAEDRAGHVLDLETAIAGTHASRADTDDVFKTDNGWRRADFAAKAPGLDWAAYFTAAGLSAAMRFVVWQPQSVTGGAALVANQPLDRWKDYLAFHQIDHYAAVLPGAVRADAAAPDPIAATNAVFGDAIGRLYVERYFPPRAKTAAVAMVANIRTAFRARLSRLSWMTPATRAAALAKLAALDVGLGYPDRWTDYAGLAIVRGDAFGNQRRAEAFAYAREVAKLGRSVDPAEWPGQIHPQQAGAILDFSPNSMQFAAGLLQPPYFDADGDAAANYGSAGAGIAHEISHSFDELGNLYDAQGRLGLWWAPADLAGYRAATAPLATQLDACAPLPGLFTHGKQVLGESASDLGGLMVAYDAYRLSRHGKPDSLRGGLTGDQRFFIAFAERWRRLQTDAALRTQVETDPHAPPQCRSELVRNADAWARAFSVGPGDRLFVRPEARVRIW